MKKRSIMRTRGRGQQGYALLLVMFLLTLLVLMTITVAPSVLTDARREKETEMVWRGKQYVRGIKHYYMKVHRFPTELDDLTKPKTGIRFMRQAYKDPMNLVDGSWRLIYVGPNGQLIGSLSDRSIGMSGMGAQRTAGGFGSSLSSLSTLGSGQGLMNASANSVNSSGFGSQATGNTQTGAIGTALANGNASTNAAGAADPSAMEDPTQPHSIAGPMDASNTIGGNIIGVGSKINKRSFMVYEKAKNYKLFEFIWDPSKDMTMGRASTGIGTPIQGTIGTNPAGTGNSNSPFSNGMNPSQNPNQNQNQVPNSNPGNALDPNQMPPLQAPPSQ